MVFKSDRQRKAFWASKGSNPRSDVIPRITLKQARSRRKPFDVRKSVARAIKQKKAVFQTRSVIKREDGSNFTNIDFSLSRSSANKTEGEIRGFSGRSLVSLKTTRVS